MSLFDLLVDAYHAFGLLALGLVGAAALAGIPQTSASAVRLARTPETRVAEFEPGRVTGVGDARAAGEPLIAPLSGEPCVAFVLTEWTADFSADSLSQDAVDLSGLEWWEDDSAIETTVVEAVPFDLRDYTGEVRVDPHPPGESAERPSGETAALDHLRNVDLDDPPSAEATSGDGDSRPESLERALERHDDLGGDHRRWRYVERRVPAEELSVTGRFVSEDGGVVVNDGSEFVLSNTTAAATARYRAGVAVVLLVVAAAAFTLVGVGLRRWFGVAVGL